jgi:hypothetical protein
MPQRTHRGWPMHYPIFTSVRYGRIAFVSATHEATQFAGPHKIPYGPIHNSNLLTEARRSVLNRHRRGYHLEAPNFRSDHFPSFPSSIVHFSLITSPGLQLCHSIDHLAKPHSTSKLGRRYWRGRWGRRSTGGGGRRWPVKRRKRSR